MDERVTLPSAGMTLKLADHKADVLLIRKRMEFITITVSDQRIKTGDHVPGYGD